MSVSHARASGIDYNHRYHLHVLHHSHLLSFVLPAHYVQYGLRWFEAMSVKQKAVFVVHRGVSVVHDVWSVI